MGGNKETKIGGKKKEKAKGRKEINIGRPKPTKFEPPPAPEQELRIHENGGEVHFHDDEGGVKVAIPSGEWYKLWEEASHSTGSFTYIDKKNGTILDLAITTPAIGMVDAQVNISPIQQGKTFQELEAFIKG
jgi:hypothetical protein